MPCTRPLPPSGVRAPALLHFSRFDCLVTLSPESCLVWRLELVEMRVESVGYQGGEGLVAREGFAVRSIGPGFSHVVWSLPFLWRREASAELTLLTVSVTCHTGGRRPSFLAVSLFSISPSGDFPAHGNKAFRGRNATTEKRERSSNISRHTFSNTKSSVYSSSVNVDIREGRRI